MALFSRKIDDDEDWPMRISDVQAVSDPEEFHDMEDRLLYDFVEMVATSEYEQISICRVAELLQAHLTKTKKWTRWYA